MVRAAGPAQSQGLRPSESIKGGDMCDTPEHDPRITVLLTSELLGTGPEELGRVLIRAFVKTCKGLAPNLKHVILINTGVRLALEGSPLIDDLHALEAGGAEVLSCGTCLDYFQAKESLRAGRVSNMQEIVTTLAASDRVLQP